MKKIFKPSSRTIWFYLILLIILLASCHDSDNPVDPVVDKGNYTLSVKYDSIKTYPKGGGIFVIKMTPDPAFTGKIKLMLSSDNVLKAGLSKSELNSGDSVFDIVLSPVDKINAGTYNIMLIAYHNGLYKTIQLNVEIVEWGENINDAQLKLLQFKSYIVQNCPQYNSIFTNQLHIYSTYPDILIVEHYSIITKDYEARLCYHVMVPPYDWSKLLIRNRNKMDADIALERFTDGAINTMPVEDYPIIYGY